MVYYRKYRPQNIEELDSKEVRDKLHSVLESPSVAHAFLFTGPKGLGKTSTARIVAKALNCEKMRNEKGEMKNKDKTSHLSSLTSHLRDVEPCNKCDQCISITNGTNMDILEIDGASNRGIDEIRDLREKIKLSPLSAQKKVYIIDEVHMLTTEAFNALLKTLEEPPSHVVFILCTTEPHKVPDTIVSRCLSIQFKKATEEELVRSFQRILKGEKLEGEEDGLKLIARLSDGSFRDGVKILEEMALVSKDKKITKDLVEQKYQISSIQYQIAQMIRNLENKDIKAALEGVAKLTNEGIEMGNFLQSLIENLHNILLAKAGVVGSSQLSEDFAAKLEMGEIKKLIELLSKAHSELKYAVLPQIPLELAIVEWGLQAGINTDVNADQHGSIIPRESVVKSALISNKTPVITKEMEVEKTPIAATQQGITNYSENDALWNSLIDKIKAYNHSVAGVLRGCRLKSYDGKSLIIETNFKFHKEKLGELKTWKVLEDACKDITKKDIKIEVLLKPAVAKALAGQGR
ncbi:MAG: DNA polymerase III subunit gamma/tau [bacterium]|nr:DNA polymerase III subunit gamma/tau [bacterium]